MASQANPDVFIFDDEDADNFLTNEQLLSRTVRYLTILEHRIINQQPETRQLQRLSTRRRMSIIGQCHNLTSHNDHDKQGFVFGMTVDGRTWTASSDNLRSWWKEEVNFERIGPLVISSPNSQTLGLESLKELQDTTLSSIISASMQKCTPPQRLCSFEKGEPGPMVAEGGWGWLAVIRGQEVELGVNPEPFDDFSNG